MRFEVEEIRPTGHVDIWKAVIAVRTPEKIGDIGVGQNATLTVRFSYPEGQSATGLIEAATRKAEECLASAASFLAGRSAKELQESVRAEQAAQQAEWDKPFEFSPVLPS